MVLLHKHHTVNSYRMFILLSFIITVVLMGSGIHTFASDKNDSIHTEVLRLMEKGKIPGLSLIVISEGTTSISSYGYADLRSGIKVAPETRFEIGSCTKAFTALALLALEKEGLLKLDDPIKNYIPWFRATYKDNAESISIRQLLHHTSGIPQETISDIPVGNGADALENTVRRLNGIKLNKIPGTSYEYASVNYDIIGLIIQQLTHQSFENVIRTKVLLPLGMLHTSVGYNDNNSRGIARGYKIGFSRARLFDAPVYRGNNPAAYIITDANDMAKWLSFQMGIYKSNTSLDSLVMLSHVRDATVAPDKSSLSSYAAGWEIYLTGEGIIAHSGRNPNFSAEVQFIPEKGVGVAILANSNSSGTGIIAEHVLKMLSNKEVPVDPLTSDYDNDFTTLVIGLGAYLLLVLFYIGFKVHSIINGTSRFVSFTGLHVFKLLASLIVLGVFLFGIYLLPQAFAKFSWSAAVVWAPVSFIYMAWALAVSFILSYVVQCINTCFPHNNKYINKSPELVVLSMISGIGNAAVIILLTSSIGRIGTYTNQKEYYIVVFYFLLALFAYIYGRKIVQTQLIKLAVALIYDIRIRLLNKIFSSCYEDFEKMNRGSIYTTLNNDTDRIGSAANVVVNLSTNMITTISVFGYLMIISFKAAIATIIVIAGISLLYYRVGRKSNVLFELVRNTFSKYLELLSGMIEGFKELSLHLSTRLGYRKDIEHVNMEFRDRSIMAQIGFVNAFLAGESMLIMTLALVVFVFPGIFPALTSGVVLSYIVVMLYLIGPINVILSSIPDVMQIRVAMKRVRTFLKDLPETIDLQEEPATVNYKTARIERLFVKGLKYRYAQEDGKKGFEVGPVSFELRRGDVLFITGSNGSGKSTLIKLLTGLYSRSSGEIEIDGKLMDAVDLGEYFSVVFNPFYLFKKLYAFETADNTEEINSYLEVLGLTGKVTIQDGNYTTTNLSQGQRKRLALLQCFLEDRSIYLFDEWAAEQDPEYRRFFYKELIPEMKRRGKLIIIVSHDDQYFQEADMIIKLNNGKQEEILLNDKVIIQN
jgi:cyclic peptide transporter